jgi:transcriptional regulator with XRE-family HTH domain
MGKRKRTDSLRQRFGRRVRALRKAAELSQMELGQRAGLDYTYIGGIERGERNLSLDSIGKVAKGLDVEIESLFAGRSFSSDLSLDELVALLERRDPDATKHALRFREGDAGLAGRLVTASVVPHILRCSISPSARAGPHCEPYRNVAA